MPSPRPSRAALGRVVRELRTERRLTIEGLAAAAGMHPTYLSGIEHGLRNPSWDKLCELAIALNVRLSEIVLRAEQLEEQSQADPGNQVGPRGVAGPPPRRG